jgi:hypothetical protein
MKKVILILIISCSISSYGQIKPTIYTENNLGVWFGLSNKVSGELRVKTNRFENFFLDSKDIKPFESEFLISYTTLNKEYYKLRLGIGTSFIFENIDPLNSFIFPVNFEIIPFKENSFSFISFIFEPSIVTYIEGSIDVRGLLGIRLKL